MYNNPQQSLANVEQEERLPARFKMERGIGAGG
jgi:hypothetical protein